MILVASLACILVLIAAGVYFLGLSNETSQSGDMMGTGGPSPLFSLVVSIILIVTAVAIGIGLLAYFIYPTISRAGKTQVLTVRKGEEKIKQGNVDIRKFRDRVATGYTSLDQLLYGGIPKGFAVVLTSPPCKQRDSLIRSFLEAGAKNDEVTLFVTTNPKFAVDLATEFPSFYLVACTSQVGEIVKKASNIAIFSGIGDLTGISINLTRIIRALPESMKRSRRICIDLLSDVLLLHGSIQTRRWLTELLTLLKSSEFTTLAILDRQMHHSEDTNAVLGLFEGEIDISEAETTEGLQTILKIKRMSNQEYTENGILLSN